MRFIITFSFFLYALATFSQSVNTENNFLVHLDKPFYITGDKIWYKLYYPEKMDQVAIKVLLVNSEGKVLQDFFHKTRQSSSLNGFVALPYNYNTGQYRLLFNSLIKTQKIVVNEKTQAASFIDSEEEINLAEISFPVYNDLTKGTDDSTILTSYDEKEQNDFKSDLMINASLNQDQIKSRDKINLDIQISSINSNNVGTSEISIAVIPKEIRLTESSGLNYFSLGPVHNRKLNGILSKDIYLKGSVFSSDGKKLQLNVIGAYTNKLNKINYTKSDKEGAFTLKFPDFYGPQTVQFLPYEREVEEFSIQLDDALVPNQETTEVIYNESIEKFLEQNRTRKKLLQYYNYLEDNVEISRKANDEMESKPDARYVVAEYEKFEKVYDFFSELITPLQFKIVKKEILASMSNPKANNAFTTNLMGNPLFLINGLATRNAGYASELSMSNIETIELFNSPDELRKQFNILGLSGVVKIKTLTPLFDIPEEDKEDLFNINGLQQNSQFIEFTPKSNTGNLPYFYSTVYWNPTLQTNKDGQLSLSFYQTDDHGEFSIIIVVQDEYGRRGIQVIDYTVN